MQLFCSIRSHINYSTRSRTTMRCHKFMSGAPLAISVRNGTRCKAFFNFNKNNNATDTAPSLTREDFGKEEVEDYFNYMGMLASEGTYDRMDAMLASGEAPVDLLLLMACSENDTPKVEELLKANADPTVKDLNGKTPFELCNKDEIKEMLQEALSKRS